MSREYVSFFHRRCASLPHPPLLSLSLSFSLRLARALVSRDSSHDSVVPFPDTSSLSTSLAPRTTDASSSFFRSGIARDRRSSRWQKDSFVLSRRFQLIFIRLFARADDIPRIRGGRGGEGERTAVASQVEPHRPPRYTSAMKHRYTCLRVYSLLLLPTMSRGTRYSRVIPRR